MNINEIIRSPDCLNDTLNKKIHENDQMFTGKDHRYFGCGADAIRKICSILNNLNIDQPKSILDFACGFGRVARYFNCAFPNAKLAVSDVMPAAVDFCAKEFDAIPLLSAPDLAILNLEKKFSLIWSGSLMTHLSEEKAIQLLAFFERHLEENGVVIFTLHGRYAAHKWDTDKPTMQLKESDGKKLSALFNGDEYAYADYPHMTGYGMSLAPLYWMVNQLNQLPSLRVVSFIERGWDNHQDVIALMKSPVNDPWEDTNPNF